MVNFVKKILLIFIISSLFQVYSWNASAKSDSLVIIHSQKHENLIYYYYPNVPKVEFYYNGEFIREVILGKIKSKNKIFMIFAKLGLEEELINFSKTQQANELPPVLCVDTVMVYPIDDAGNLEKLEEDFYKVQKRLLLERNPDEINYSLLENIGNGFSLFFNVAGFIPKKIFEYTILAGGWKLLSDEDKKRKIEEAMIDGVLENDSLSEQLAAGYKKCITKLPEDRDEDMDKEVCAQYLKLIKKISKKFSDKNLKDFKNMTYENMEKLAKKIRVYLISEISLENLKQTSFSKIKPLKISEKVKLRRSAFTVIKDYNSCLSKANNDDEVNSCDRKIAVSAPYRIGKEVMKTKTDQSISCLVDREDYSNIYERAKKQFDSCSEQNYFSIIDKLELEKKKKNKDNNEKLDTSNIMKACIFTSMLDSVKSVSDIKVNSTVKEQLEGMAISKKKSFDAKIQLNNCLRTKGLLHVDSNEYNYKTLLNLEADGLKDIISTCTNDLTKNTARKIFRYHLENNSNINSSFYDADKSQAVTDIMDTGFESCLKLYPNPDPKKCEGMTKVKATRKVMEENLKNKVLMTLADKDEMTPKELYELPHELKQQAALIFTPTKKILNQCMDNIDKFLVEKVRIRNKFIKNNPQCEVEAQKTCFDLKNNLPECETLSTDFKEADASSCLKRSVGSLSEKLSEIIIKRKIESNEKLKKLNVKFSPDELKQFNNSASSCYKRLLKCDQGSLFHTRDDYVEDIRCTDKEESIKDVKTKIDVIAFKCESYLYTKVLPLASGKIVKRQLDDKINNWNIKTKKHRLTFLLLRNNTKDKKEIKTLSEEIKILEQKQEIQKEKITNLLVKDFFENIKKEKKLDDMLAHTDELTNKASWAVIEEVLADTYSQYAPSDKKYTEDKRLKDEIQKDILNESEKKKFMSIKDDKVRDKAINSIRLRLTRKVSQKVIKDSLKKSIPLSLGRNYRLNTTMKISKEYDECLGNDPDKGDICANRTLLTATERIYNRSIQDEIRKFAPSNEKDIDENLLESLDKLAVEKVIQKNSDFVKSCLVNIDLNLSDLEYKDASKGCTNIGLLDLSKEMFDEFLNKYDSFLTQEEKERVKNNSEVCLDNISQIAKKETFSKDKVSSAQALDAFSKNNNIDTDWVKSRLNTCSEKFKADIKASFLRQILNVFNLINFDS